MGNKRLDKLCQAVLPPGYRQIRRQGPRIQKFLEQNLPEPVNRCVTLLTLNDEEIVIAAASPTVVNFLRLHSGEIQQQLYETFNLQQRLRFRAIPDSLLQLQQRDSTKPPRQASAESIDAITRNAQWIEDEDLKSALLNLADSLKSK